MTRFEDIRWPFAPSFVIQATAYPPPPPPHNNNNISNNINITDNIIDDIQQRYTKKSTTKKLLFSDLVTRMDFKQPNRTKRIEKVYRKIVFVLPASII